MNESDQACAPVSVQYGGYFAPQHQVEQGTMSLTSGKKIADNAQSRSKAPLLRRKKMERDEVEKLVLQINRSVKDEISYYDIHYDAS